VIEITEKLRALRSEVARAAHAANRNPDSVTIVAVSKGHPVEAIRAARAAGLTDFGENYVQEALPKIAALGEGPTWHFTGALQANKTRAVAENFQWVQTVTSPHLAERLSRQRPHGAGALQVCIQLKPQAIGAEAASRGGVAGEQVLVLARAIRALPGLRLRGLMFMPHPDLPPGGLHAEFERARGVFDALRREWPDLDTLSMGMSGDFAGAIAAGSTLIRIGTGLFGPRATAQ
jgi:pyridoxal phosphate enzyme (YggS family)